MNFFLHILTLISVLTFHQNFYCSVRFSSWWWILMNFHHINQFISYWSILIKVIHFRHTSDFLSHWYIATISMSFHQIDPFLSQWLIIITVINSWHWSNFITLVEFKDNDRSSLQRYFFTALEYLDFMNRILSHECDIFDPNGKFSSDW